MLRRLRRATSERQSPFLHGTLRGANVRIICNRLIFNELQWSLPLSTTKSSKIAHKNSFSLKDRTSVLAIRYASACFSKPTLMKTRSRAHVATENFA